MKSFFRQFLRYLFNKDNLLILVFTAVVAFAIQSINLNFDAFNPIEKMFADFDITDIYFHGIRAKADKKEIGKGVKEGEIQPDTNIIVVGFGNLPREEIINMLNIINEQKPRCIGIDAEYTAFAKDSTRAPIDTAFAETMRRTPNLVIACNASFKEATRQKVVDSDEDLDLDTLLSPHPEFRKVARIGFANLITGGSRDKVAREDLASGTFMCRSFSPQVRVEGKNINFLAVEVARLFDEKKVERFLKRKNEVEFINYYGNYEKFGYIGFSELFDLHQAAKEGDTAAKVRLKQNFHDKIVLIGFTGADGVITHVTSEEDRFYTPLNENYVGKAEKDMYGVFIHANIISMILREDYINEMPDWLNYLITFLIAYITTALFVFLHEKLDFWYDGLSILVQFLLSLFVVYGILQVFAIYKTRVDWSLGFLAIVFIPNLVEVYYGAVAKLYERRQRLRRLKNKQVATLGIDEQN
jgi:CHASE2 domain-containing sensor protein